MTSTLKQRIAAGEAVTVVNIGGANPDAVELLARHGADIVFIDCEHTGIGLDAATHCIRAARASGIATVVRSWTHDPAIITQYLDRQADGIVMPHVDSAAEAEALVEIIRAACGSAAANKLAIVQIESRKGIDAAESIAAISGIDAVLIGPSDLSYELTRARNIDVPEVQAALDDLCARLTKAGKPFGMPVSFAQMPVFKQRGATFVYHPLDMLVQTGMRELKARLAS